MEDVSVDLTRAVEHAFKILDWHENLLKEEVPPQWMWPLDHELDDWFKQIDKLRKEKYGNTESGESGEMMQNEYAEEYR